MNDLPEQYFTMETYLFLAVGDGEVPLVAILSSASLHDSQAAIPLMQMSSACATILADSAYGAEEIKAVSEKIGHVPGIASNL